MLVEAQIIAGEEFEAVGGMSVSRRRVGIILLWYFRRRRGRLKLLIESDRDRERDE